VEEHVPSKFQSRFAKSEKGIDIEMCCDALRLASAARLERLFLFTNDGDFIPLCRTLKEFGTNISILHLSAATPPNTELLREADSYDIVAKDAFDAMFFPAAHTESELISGGTSDLVREGEVASPDAVEPVSEKPETEPSDLKMIGDLDVPEQEG
jgi:NYN domain-containing protein